MRIKQGLAAFGDKLSFHLSHRFRCQRFIDLGCRETKEDVVDTFFLLFVERYVISDFQILGPLLKLRSGNLGREKPVNNSQ